jgi:hypothetical protein
LPAARFALLLRKAQKRRGRPVFSFSPAAQPLKSIVGGSRDRPTRPVVRGTVGLMPGNRKRETKMKVNRLLGLCAAVACLALVAGTVRAADDEVPTLRNATEREKEETARKIGTAIVKAARLKVKDVKLEEHKLAKKDKSAEYKIKMTYKGAISGLFKKKPFTAEIVIKIDTSNAVKWEVKEIEYSDDNKVSKAKPSQTKIDAIIPKLNKDK